MNLGIVQTIWNAFSDLVTSIVDINVIFYIGVGFLLLMSIFFFIRVRTSYEYKLEKASDKLNEWLFRHQNITENNLVEFNNIMKEKNTPKILRKYWQQYMLYRDKAPSEYMSTYNCIDKPLKTSSFTSNIKNFTMIYIVTAFVTFFLSMFSFTSSTKVDTLITYITQSMVASVIILFIGVVLTLALRAMQNYNIATLYQTFNVFNRYIDKASTTIPKYVDFEILFTKQEIKDGIPLLGEYLEKRARQEQEELEEAQKNAVSHEEYDFSQSGIDGALVLERAMKESETYINVKQRLLAEIQQFESEISTLTKNYENTSKDYQRKLQASKENMERLRQQQEESTNRIEVNYIRKQQQDEVKKQEQLEKDQEDATNKFNAEVNSLTAEIDDRRTQLENKRLGVQDAMQNEYQTFSNKLHKAIAQDVEKDKTETIQQVINEKDKYAQAINYLKKEVDSRDELIKAKDQTIADLATKLQDYLAGKISAETLAQETKDQLASTQESATQENEASAEGHYDDKGYYWFNNGTYYDAQNRYHDLEGNVFDENGNLLESGQVVEKEVKPQDIVQSVVASNETVAQEEPKTSESVEQKPVSEPTGKYEPNGNYVYDNGTYYDTNNLYHSNGKVYNTEGTLIEEENQNQTTPNETLVSDEKQEKVEEPPVEEPKQEEVKQEEPKQEVEQEPVKRRGRPKKEENKDGEDKPKRSVGRPKKQEGDAPSTPKRKAGRPKKEDTQEQETTEKTKTRGRPKKQTTTTEKSAVKKSAGRPKKVVEESEEAPATEKRGRGRPKKTDSSNTTQIQRKKNRIIIDL